MNYEEILTAIKAVTNEFIVIGSYALFKQGIEDSPHDCDILLSPEVSEETRAAVEALLQERFGAPLRRLPKYTGFKGFDVLFNLGDRFSSFVDVCAETAEIDGVKYLTPHGLGLYHPMRYDRFLSEEERRA